MSIRNTVLSILKAGPTEGLDFQELFIKFPSGTISEEDLSDIVLEMAAEGLLICDSISYWIGNVKLAAIAEA